MALQNRVDPFGTLVATPARGTMFGNRGGRFHDANRRLTHRRWASRQWICCVLEYRGRQREVMAPNSYTELFFLDEATAFAAGHRPCFECRRDDARRFRAAFVRGNGHLLLEENVSAAAIDRILHDERLASGGRKRTFKAPLGALPNGTMVVAPESTNRAALLWHGALYPWSFEGYGAPTAAPDVVAAVLTPRAVVGAFRAGYVPGVHASRSAADAEG